MVQNWIFLTFLKTYIYLSFSLSLFIGANTFYKK